MDSSSQGREDRGRCRQSTEGARCQRLLTRFLLLMDAAGVRCMQQQAVAGSVLSCMVWVQWNQATCCRSAQPGTVAHLKPILSSCRPCEPDRALLTWAARPQARCSLPFASPLPCRGAHVGGAANRSVAKPPEFIQAAFSPVACCRGPCESSQEEEDALSLLAQNDQAAVP
jgi:hypothetical protein